MPAQAVKRSCEQTTSYKFIEPRDHDGEPLVSGDKRTLKRAHHLLLAGTMARVVKPRLSFIDFPHNRAACRRDRRQGTFPITPQRTQTTLVDGYSGWSFVACIATNLLA